MGRHSIGVPSRLLDGMLATYTTTIRRWSGPKYDESCLAEKDRLRPSRKVTRKWLEKSSLKTGNRLGFLASDETTRKCFEGALPPCCPVRTSTRYPCRVKPSATTPPGELDCSHATTPTQGQDFGTSESTGNRPLGSVRWQRGR
jgi:hypothetical protein